MRRTNMKRTPLKRKTPMRKGPKAKTRGWYSKELDKIAKRFAKERDGYTCQMSGEKVSGSNAHGSHVIPVSAGLNLRWDLHNIKCLSYHNHLNVWHKSPLEAAEWFRKKFPWRWQYLQERREVRTKISTPDLMEFYEIAKGCDGWKEYQTAYENFF